VRRERWPLVNSLIWDAGGTLFDTYPAVVEAALVAVAQLGGRADPGWVLSLFRQSTVHAVASLARSLAVDQTEIATRFEAAYDAVGAAEQPPFPYVRDCCRFVAEAGGRNYIVTHRDLASLERLLDGHRMRGYFADWITKADPFPRKPDSASLTALAKRHELDPARCLAIADRDLDVVAGDRAGMWTCPYGAAEHTIPVNLRITGFDHLLDWLRRNFHG